MKTWVIVFLEIVFLHTENNWCIKNVPVGIWENSNIKYGFANINTSVTLLN